MDRWRVIGGWGASSWETAGGGKTGNKGVPASLGDFYRVSPCVEAAHPSARREAGRCSTSPRSKRGTLGPGVTRVTLTGTSG